MLKSLFIRNYAIIDELSLDFSDGFTVFTGETGAGKSIIVGALSYLIKGKADPSVIRNGTDKAVIEGVFSVEEYMKQALDEADIEYDDELIIRRVISRDNHNSIKINQCSVTLSFLTDLFNEHIDIHSQKDSQYLLSKNNHLRLLDKYIRDPQMLDEYREAYIGYREALKEYEELENNTYNQSELEFYRYDLKELDEAAIDPEEENDLLDKEKRYKSAEKYINVLNNAIDLYEGEEGISEKLSSLIKSLALEDNAISTIRENMRSLYYSLEEETEGLKKILSQFSDDDLNIEFIEERLYTYSKLKRKHGTDSEGLIRKMNELKEKIAFFEDRDFVLAEKKKALDLLYDKAYALAKKMSDVRKEKALVLEEQIMSNARDLMLPNVLFRINIDESKMSPNGIDDVEFYVSMNKGEDLKPLRNAASGGEISRLMLALKSVFTALSNTTLVIFDEIDTGVSGKVALAIGQKIHEIAETTQVLCITHLAAVAACAKQHFYIYKTDSEAYSNTSVKKLDHQEIIKELAMISSSDSSQTALNAAEELYQSAQESIRR